MQIVSSGDNLHEILFSGKNKKKKPYSMLSAENFTQSAKSYKVYIVNILLRIITLFLLVATFVVCS